MGSMLPYIYGTGKSPTKWGPQTIAKLVYNSNFTMVYGIYNYSFHGVHKPSYNGGGPHCEYPMSFV